MSDPSVQGSLPDRSGSDRILKFFGLPGSGSVTICMDPDLTPTPDRDLSINIKKTEEKPTLTLTLLLLHKYLLTVNTDVNVPAVSNKQIFASLKPLTAESSARYVVQCTDLWVRIQIRLKMSRIQNTAF